MGFGGWPAEALDFYEGLQADNSKTYWLEHKAVYDDLVRAPMEALILELEPEFGPGRIFRPYRDVRFSADKSPYKTQIAASFDLGGYVQLTADGLAAGRGTYMMAPDQLKRFREAVDHDRHGAALRKIVDEAARHGIEITGRERLKTVPRGYGKEHPRGDLLQLKGLVAWKQWPVAAWLGTPKAKTRVVELLRLAGPLNDWLGKHVGPSTPGEAATSAAR
jgi:uncharacterized protein (TIGR02453 family)